MTFGLTGGRRLAEAADDLALGQPERAHKVLAKEAARQMRQVLDMVPFWAGRTVRVVTVIEYRHSGNGTRAQIVRLSTEDESPAPEGWIPSGRPHKARRVVEEVRYGDSC